MKKLLAALILLAASSAAAQQQPTGFHVVRNQTPLSVDSSGETSTLTAPFVSVLASNRGTTTAYCQPGGTASSSSPAISGGGWLQFDLSGNGQFSCTTVGADTTTVNISQGFGQGAGGGGGGGGGGTGGGTVGSPNIVGGSLGGAATVEPMTAYGFYFDVSSSSNFAALIANAPNVNVGSTPTALQGKTVSTETGMSVDLNSMGGTALTQDPCFNNFANTVTGPINLTASGVIITHASTKKTYICHISFTLSANENVALVEGTGTVCATNIFGLAGGTTAATGWNFTSNGIAMGNGAGTLFSGDKAGDTHAAGADICLIASAASQLSGTITVVQQ